MVVLLSKKHKHLSHVLAMKELMTAHFPNMKQTIRNTIKKKIEPSVALFETLDELIQAVSLEIIIFSSYHEALKICQDRSLEVFWL